MMARADSISRFNRRQWRRRLAAMKPFLITFVGVALVTFAAWAVFFSTWLAVEETTVSGEQRLSAEEIAAVADIDLGTPMARVDLDEVGARIAEIPAVADVSVHRAWPHTIEITVTERQPIAQIQRGGQWWLMDVEGVVFRRIDDRRDALPVVMSHADVDHEALQEVASVVGALPADLLRQVSRLRARSMDSIRLDLTDGREIVWGSAAESGRKVEVLAVLLKQPARVYDVSVPGQPTTLG